MKDFGWFPWLCVFINAVNAVLAAWHDQYDRATFFGILAVLLFLVGKGNCERTPQ